MLWSALPLQALSAAEEAASSLDTAAGHERELTAEDNLRSSSRSVVGT